ncbi:PREDICTED: glucan endo-1,3-beta-glucosidase 14 [Tarenaya hassleriana]|uniref:glucan endo-1,3-beta-glucosidase 14 n=1 Tax=Tarenaya hassleriana TaxID=28532 RepID=UPI00053C1E7C|nr:PREDICTED: glucan endo-1,3-beta-glucosidase 14 [Tarenaya hassleriana]
MASRSLLFFRVLLLFLFLSDQSIRIHGLGPGINYGQIANNLPSPSRVAVLLRSLNISRVKLYDADPNVLYAFSNSQVDFIIGLGNEYLQNMTDPIKAQNWIQQRVTPHISRTRITSVVVGNEIFKTNDHVLISNLLPAMKSVHAALVSLGLQDQVAVTSAHSLDILQTSYPPSSGSFRQDFAQFLQPLLDFHSQIKSPFLINAYPYFAYKDNPNDVQLEYVLFQPNQGMIDPNTNLHYDNMLFAQIDAVYSAIRAMGHTDIEVRISETGWPSKGDENEVGATPENAALYNGNLLRKIQQRQGTPAKQSVPVDVYVFALFNENMKPGPTSERNYGLFYPDGTPVYNIGLQGYLPDIIYAAKASEVKILQILQIWSLMSLAFVGFILV